MKLLLKSRMVLHDMFVSKSLSPQVARRKIMAKYSRFLARKKPGAQGRVVGDMTSFLEDLKARGLDCTSILDVGANRALWSYSAKKIFPSADLYLIEPQEEMRVHLESFCKKNPGSSYVIAGAGTEPGELNLSVTDDLNSSFLPPAEWINETEQRRVPIITINDLLNEEKIKMPQLAKLDVQGFELEVLKGATQLFGHTEVFILETSFFRAIIPDRVIFHEMVDYMYRNGYVLYDFATFLRRSYDGALGQCDACFVREDGFLRAHQQWSAISGAGN